MQIPSPPAKDALDVMRSIVGESACVIDTAEVAPYVIDYRRIYQGQALLVVLPASTSEVSRIMSWFHANSVPVVPQGGNTSLMGGAVPDDSGTAVVLNLKRMNQVTEIDPVNDTMTVQACAARLDGPDRVDIGRR